MKKVLLISYFFEPFQGVGAKRLSYWANAFESDKHFQCTVITATRQVTQKQNVVFIEDPNTWQNKVIFGAAWVKPLKVYLRNRNECFDHAIISGGPFGHFPIAQFLKEQFRCKILLDFRDPFSGNVRFATRSIVERIKVQWEKKVLSQADYILTVNDCCRDILVKNSEPAKVFVVENGYDERTVDAVQPITIHDQRIHIVHAGKFYTSPASFVHALVEWNQQNPAKQFVFHHIGETNPSLEAVNSDSVIQHGEKTYAETIAIMKGCAVGFLKTSGKFLEYNTKVFDYIGCDLDVFIVTEGEIETGCIQGLTRRLGDKIFWTKAQVPDINILFARYSPSNEPFENKRSFSRSSGFDRLKQLIDVTTPIV